jgi:acyl transferase domain-containing protein
MSQTPAGAMTSVAMAETAIGSLLPPALDIAAVNGPQRCVVSGPVDALTRFERQLTDLRVAHARLHTSHAFHSRLMDGVMRPFGAALEGTAFGTPSIPFVSGVTGQWAAAHEVADASYWVRHLREPVRCGDAMRQLAAMAGAVFVEVGPGRTLGQLAAEHAQPCPCCRRWRGRRIVRRPSIR